MKQKIKKAHEHNNGITSTFMRIQWRQENELEGSYFVSVKTNDRNFTHIIPSVPQPTSNVNVNVNAVCKDLIEVENEKTQLNF